MDMKVNSERVKTLRLTKGWSQEQLAEVSGLGVRTIQRIEKDGVCSLESRNSLASAFHVESEDLQVAEGNVARLATELRILNFSRYFLIACFGLGFLSLIIQYSAGDLPLDRFTTSVVIQFAVCGAVYTMLYALIEKTRFLMSDASNK